MHPTHVAVLLAAGAGTRFTGPIHKLSSRLPATATEPAASVAERAISHALAAAIGPVVVITGSEVAVVPAPYTAQVIVRHNPRWAEGQSTSLRLGLDVAAELGAGRAVIGLADQPFIDPGAWRAVAASTHPIAVATYDGERGNPVGLDASVWPLLDQEAHRHPDAGARTLMQVRPDLVGAVPCSGSPDDIDTEEDLRRWQNS